MVGLCVGLYVGLRVVGLKVVVGFIVVLLDDGFRVVGPVAVGKLVVEIRNQLTLQPPHRWL